MAVILHHHFTDPLGTLGGPRQAWVWLGGVEGQVFVRGVGTRRLQADSQGVPELDCQSLPFGDQLNCFTDPNGNGNLDGSTPLHFAGKERDTETGEANGNDYFGARYFASGLGRFMTPDWSAKYEPVPYAKLDNPQTLNLYAYVQNNPLTMVDPDGHQGGVDFGLPPSKPWDGWWSGADTMDGRNCALNADDCSLDQIGFSDSSEQGAEDRHASIINDDYDPVGIEHDSIEYKFTNNATSKLDAAKQRDAKVLGEALSGSSDPKEVSATIAYVYLNLNPSRRYTDQKQIGLHGGNFNFDQQIGNMNVLEAFHTGRNGIMPSVHIESQNGYSFFHVDAANGASIAGPIHWVWDVFMGTYIFKDGLPQ